MESKIELTSMGAKPVLSVRVVTTIGDLPALINDSYRRIADYLAELGETPADAPFAAYHRLGTQDIDIELGVPVSVNLPGKDDIKAGETVSGDAVVYMHEGPYTDLKPVYEKIFEWIGENKCTPKGLYYEYYFNSPGGVSEKKLATRIVIPVEK
ncbi:MAG: GyrI-like domain-containing protein [Dehalococcoidales bacterium]|nr:GyrI-like domain-containing protein [Dehalococcoidales bacterium]